ncbi:MAG: nucleotidyl transferase AbiEii/AbiGii toxin family protein [Bacteroidota bacterium]|nr:nucleotidyl transferase AbiEii/AbiGii toxin family protein [Bacteroidota bacterium]
MILKKEIEKIALQENVSRSTVDKDWVLGHFIDAIFSIPICRDSLVFKGGTCLKKCYIPDYRFSEDLDFTSVNPNFVLDQKLLQEITTLITQRTEIPLFIDSIKELKHKDMPTGYAAIIKFWGADHLKNQAPPPPERWATSVKIEIIRYEKMLFPVSLRSITHAYSDKLALADQPIPCYDLQEVMSEKLRALIQRSYSAPRDYFDIWYLSKKLAAIEWPVIVDAFHEKMKFKNIEFTGIDQFLNDDVDRKLTGAWKNSLAHQIPHEQLPPYNQVKEELSLLFEKTFTTD